MAHPTRFERVTFAFGGQGKLLPRDYSSLPTLTNRLYHVDFPDLEIMGNCYRSPKIAYPCLPPAYSHNGNGALMKLTKRVLETVKPEPSRDVYLWDDEVAGYGLR